MRIKEFQPLPPRKSDFTPPPGRKERRAEQRKNPQPPKPPTPPMEQTAKTPRGHIHAEAFCHMSYTGSSQSGTIILSIWNSRDGVTPFCLQSKEFGIELQHTGRNMVYNPDFLPKKGDLIWTSYTPEQAAESARKRFQGYVDQLKDLEGMEDAEILQKYKWDARAGLKAMIEKGVDALVEETVKNYIENGEPRLELVKEDWKPKSKEG